MGVLFFCSLNLFAQDWKDPQWLKLLIYRKDIFGYKSEADSGSFFLHPHGRKDPKAELESLIEALRSNQGDQSQNPFCRFPARVRWLRKSMALPEPSVDCTDYEAFRKRLSAKSISVVFSSYYLNNPASSFGHTFIRLGKQTREEREQDSTATELLDTGINYGALTGNANPVVFAVGGLAGFFSGNYNAVPYYYKVREYNDYETRDLWSYQLDMTQEEIDMIVDHIWELGHTSFDYYFLTRNCSYHVLSILETARPSLNLHGHLPFLYTIPSETLKALAAENLITKVTYRPAPSSLFYHQLTLLDRRERKEVRDLVFRRNEISKHPPERAALIYDTALSLVDYKYAKEILKGDEEAQGLKRPLLIQRSRIPVSSPELDFSDKLREAPHLGHGQKRLGVSYLRRGGKNLTDVEWRFAFHDLLDNNLGYPPKTKIDVLKALLRTDGEKFQLREFSFVDVLMLGKWDVFNKASSWKVRVGQWQTRWHHQDLSSQGMLGGYGVSRQFGMFSPYVLAHLETSYVSERLQRMKFGSGSDVGLLTEFNPRLKWQSSFEWRVNPWNESRFFNEMRYSENDYGVGVYHQIFMVDGIQEGGLRIFKYL